MSYQETRIGRLEKLKGDLDNYKKAVLRLEAAIKFIETNPGAEAFLESL